MGLEVYQEEILRTPGLRNYWTFDGESLAALFGGVALESPVPGSYVPGCVGDKAMLFDGISRYVKTASPIDLTAFNSVALMMWWYPNVYDLVNIENIAELSINALLETTAFDIRTSGNVANDPVSIFHNGDVGVNRAYYNKVTFGWGESTWKHIAAVFDKSLASDEVGLFLNGALLTASLRDINSNNTNNFGNHTLYLASRAGASLFANHTLDEVALFAPAPTAQQILDIYNSYPARHGIWGRSIGEGLIS